ncbi:MAG: GntR family transcriptional regulator [Telmatospirillum sp.]|nr:GntR family transcriptional regulator [Telmatospirillum sp.]
MTARETPGVAEQAICEVLHKAITERRLPAGTRLVEDQLARLFCVSRTRIRSVLQTLARDRMVTLLRNRGAFVSCPTVAEAREVFQARRLIETALAREAAAGCQGQNGVGRLRDHLAREADAHERRDRQEEIRLSGEFHLLLAAVVGNATLTDFLGELTARSSLVMAVYGGGSDCDCWIGEHRAIVDALEQGDGDMAAHLMERHLTQVEGRLRLTGDGAGARVDVKTVLGL